jgi:lysophospholipase L1-like esterase
MGAVVLAALVAACAPAAARSASPPPGNPPSTLGVDPVTPSTVPLPPDTATTGPVLLLGDSLTVGVEPFLPALLPGWQVQFDARVGRTTEQGIASLAADPGELAPTVVVGLGTNDQTTAEGFSQNVDKLMAMLGDRRVLWVNVARKGYDAFDAVLAADAGRYTNLELIDWASAYSSHPKEQAADGIHATDDGYRLRSQIIASALLAPSPAVYPSWGVPTS